jgi:hypothetical protein
MSSEIKFVIKNKKTFPWRDGISKQLSTETRRDSIENQFE